MSRNLSLKEDLDTGLKPDLLKNFEPAAFLCDRHLMTIVPTLWPRRFPGSLKKERVEHLVEVSESARVLVEVNKPASEQLKGGREKVAVLLVHGLEGCADSPYMLGVAAKALEQGFSVVRMNLRNCGGTEHLSDTLYNAGMSEDVNTVATWAVGEYGFEKLFLVGFSLGGNLVLKASAEERLNEVAGVCAISPSLELERAVDRLESGLNRIYQNTFLFSLRRKIKKKAALFPARFSLDKLGGVRTVKDFDEAYTAPDGGYRSARHYYEQSSALAKLASIEVPTLIISALDDPIVPGDVFERKEFFPPSIKLLTPDFGGHGGFLSALPREKGAQVTNTEKEDFFEGGSKDRFWAEEQALRFCLENI